jgi:hypothetical protein
MKSKAFRWAVPIIAVLVLAAGTGARAQNSKHIKFSGTINDYTPASTGGPWEVRGHWTLIVNERSGKADFSAALTMERSDLGVIQNGGGDLNNPVDRNAHTHHITLVGGEVTPITGGFRVTTSKDATITGNGNLPPPFGSGLSPMTIDITGGNSVTFSNIAVSFGDMSAINHFGANPLHGVVRSAEYVDAFRR